MAYLFTSEILRKVIETARKSDTGSPDYRPSSFEPEFVNTATALADLNDGHGRRRLDEIFSEANEEIEAARLIEAAIAAMFKSENGLKDEQP